MSHNFKNLKKKEKGQGLVEYALILVLVAIVVIAALMILGPIIGNVFSTINTSISTASGGGPWSTSGDGGVVNTCTNPPMSCPSGQIAACVGPNQQQCIPFASP